MDFYLEAEAKELLYDFESAYSTLYEEYSTIKEYAEKYYAGGIQQFIYDVRRSQDYFSLAKPMIAFYDEFKNEVHGTKQSARGGFSEKQSEKSQNQPPKEETKDGHD